MPIICFIASKLRFNIISIVEKSTSSPKRTASSTQRLAAVLQAATSAFKSNRFHCGVRTLCKINSNKSDCKTPFLYNLVGGIRIPSWKIVVASIGIDPGTMPPLSDICPNIADQAMCRPSLNTGTKTTQSGK